MQSLRLPLLLRLMAYHVLLTFDYHNSERRISTCSHIFNKVTPVDLRQPYIVQRVMSRNAQLYLTGIGRFCYIIGPYNKSYYNNYIKIIR